MTLRGKCRRSRLESIRIQGGAERRAEEEVDGGDDEDKDMEREVAVGMDGAS